MNSIRTQACRRVVVPAAGGVCWGYVDDIANGHLLAMQSGTPGESYMLAGPSAPLIEGLRLVARLAGQRSPIGLPGVVVAATAGAAGLVGRVLPLPPAYAAESLRSSLATYYGSPAKAIAELGWSCRDMDAGFGDLISASRSLATRDGTTGIQVTEDAVQTLGSRGDLGQPARTAHA